MPLRTVYDIQLNDEAFQEHLRTFERWRDAVSQVPDGWAKINEAVGRGGEEFAGIGASMAAIVESMSRTNREADALERHAGGAQRFFSGMAREARDISHFLGDAARSILRWTGVGTAAAGLLGFGSVWGLDEIGAWAGNLRRTSTGMGFAPGNAALMQSFQTNLGRLVDPGQFLGGINTALHDISQRWTLNAAGLTDSQMGGDTGQVGLSLLQSAWRTLHGTPPAQLAQVMQARGLDRFLSLQDAVRLQQTPYSELDELIHQTRYDAAGNRVKITDEDLKHWQDFQNALQRAGNTLWDTIVRDLEPLAGPLKELSQGFTQVVDAFLQSPALKEWLGDASEGLKEFAGYIRTPQFQQDVQMFIREIGELAKRVHDALQWLGLIPDNSPPGPTTLGQVWDPHANGGRGWWAPNPAGSSSRTTGQWLGDWWHSNMPTWLGGGGGGAGPQSRIDFDNQLRQLDPKDPKLTAAASILAWNESRDRDVRNNQYSVSGMRDGVPVGRTASGYWQMLATNWHKYGEGIVDFSKYPEAVGAPLPLQFKVWSRMYQAEGVRPWTSGAGGPISDPDAFAREVQQRAAQFAAAPKSADGPPGQAQQHASFQAIVGDSIAKGLQTVSGVHWPWARVGARPDEVLEHIVAQGGAFGDRSVLLSSGISNDPRDMADVEKQLAVLHAVGAKTTLLGVGDRPDYDRLHINEHLQALASKYGATFAGPLTDLQGDHVHPHFKPYWEHLTAALGNTAAYSSPQVHASGEAAAAGSKEPQGPSGFVKRFVSPHGASRVDINIHNSTGSNATVGASQVASP